MGELNKSISRLVNCLFSLGRLIAGQLILAEAFDAVAWIDAAAVSAVVPAMQMPEARVERRCCCRKLLNR